ncbi:RPA1 [Ecytonucleospora hepatopenaei]|uniref:Replication protein A subunit n=1 Tax=Ecytonucleospora hepatopenaei TaxID=646526 RepID=A0A1W0E5S4_9MICR|nr:RPA1 [Ecytonucleospora hepatopenaei]
MELKKDTIFVLSKKDTNNKLYDSPVVQLLDAYKTASKDNKLRYKGYISDGEYKIKCALASEICQQLEAKQIQSNDFLQLNRFTVSQNETHTYVLISSIHGFEKQTQKIGNPKDIKEKGKNEKSEENKCNSEVIKKQKKETGISFFAIKDLNPFISAWTITGRVVSKSDIKTYKTPKGDNKLFSFEFLDKTAQIKIVCFGNAVDLFFPVVQNGKVYEIINGSIKMANQKYSRNKHEYEIHLDDMSKMNMVEDDGVPAYTFSFNRIKDITCEQQFVDVCGIVKEVYEMRTVTVKSTGKELEKRDILLLDETGSIKITLWGEKAAEDFTLETICCFKGVKTSNYNGVSLSTVTSSQIVNGSEEPEAIKILAWYEKEGKSVKIEKPNTLIKRQFISNLIEENAEYGFILGTIMYVKEDSLYYSACPNEGCNKKVTQEDNGEYRCEKCNDSYEKCSYRYMATFNVSDCTGQVWVTVFDEAAKSLFNVTAEELNSYKETDNEEATKIVKDAIGKEVYMKIRIKDSVYNEQVSKKITCGSFLPVDFKSTNEFMYNALVKEI